MLACVQHYEIEMSKVSPWYFKAFGKPVGDGIDSITAERYKRDAAQYLTPGE